MKKILLILMAMFAFGLQNVSAQDGIKIITNHPDFKIKVKRCAASGKTVVIDLILTNEGTNDIEGVYVCGGAWDCSEAYDDEGNIYKDSSILPSSIRRTANTCARARSTISMKSRRQVPSGVG